MIDPEESMHLALIAVDGWRWHKPTYFPSRG